MCTHGRRLLNLARTSTTVASWHPRGTISACLVNGVGSCRLMSSVATRSKPLVLSHPSRVRHVAKQAKGSSFCW